ncbi:YhdB family protein [Sutcliffiella deserti]|uniref:YhdB family protein n=1 Tax=Sutcliffiella deserti TaxID=2875501 RepID=UPI001CBD6E93|nr:YhdB family protein [Sutcliffiella deserti]
MNTVDYDRALYYTHRSEWDNLLILMVRTKDDLLSKYIEHFLHSYNFSKDYKSIELNLYQLLRYIDHAVNVSTTDMDHDKEVSHGYMV